MLRKTVVISVELQDRKISIQASSEKRALELFDKVWNKLKQEKKVRR